MGTNKFGRACEVIEAKHKKASEECKTLRIELAAAVMRKDEYGALLAEMGVIRTETEEQTNAQTDK